MDLTDRGNSQNRLSARFGGQRHLRVTIGFAIGRGAGLALQAALFVLAARMYHASTLGIQLTVFSTAMLVCGLTDLGVSVRIARDREAGALLLEDHRMFLGIRLGIALLTGVIWGIAATVTHSIPFLLAIPFLVLEALSLSSTGMLTVGGRPFAVAGTMLAERLSSLAAFGLLFRSSNGLVLALTVGSVAGSSSGWLLLHYPMPTLSSVSRFWSALRGNWAFGLTTTMAQAQNLDVPIVNWFAGVAQVPLYALPASMITPLLFLASAESANVMGAAARLSNLELDAKRCAVRSLVRRTLPMVGLSVVASLLVALMSPDIARLAFGSRYAKAAGPLRVLSVGIALASVNVVVAALLQGLGYERLVARVVTWAIIVGMAATTIGAYFRGAEGAAYGFLVLHMVPLVPLSLGVWQPYFRLSRKHARIRGRGVKNVQ